jgi:tetratricopeptide (TPR) repeat protein
MQQMASWRYWLFIGIIGISLLTAPARSQQQAAPTAPTPGADAKSYVEYGIANGTKGNLDAAIGAFNQAISIDPKYAAAYFFRGKAHSLQNKLDEAISDYSQAIQFDPNYKEAYYQRGCLRGQKGDFDAAISDFSEIIKLDSKYAPAYYQSGHVKYFKGDLDGALDQLNQALSLDPNFSLCYFIRGLVRHAQEHREEALSDFQKSLGLGFSDAAFWIWIIETESGQRGLAQKDLSDALNNPESFKPDDWPSQIGNFLLERITEDQLMDKAKAENEAESNGILCQAWFYPGMLKHLSGDSKGAQDCFAKAIATGSKGSEEFIEASREAAESQKQ